MQLPRARTGGAFQKAQPAERLALLHANGLVLQLVHGLLVQVVEVGVLQCVTRLAYAQDHSSQKAAMQDHPQASLDA